MLKPSMDDTKLCRVFFLSKEFKYVTVRQDEKMKLAKRLNLVPCEGKLGKPSAKIYALLEGYISQLKLEGLALASSMVFFTQVAV